jgi:hypothetical protein
MLTQGASTGESVQDRLKGFKPKAASVKEAKMLHRDITKNERWMDNEFYLSFTVIAPTK